MILSDFDLENMIRDERLVVQPFRKEIIRENGVDLRLDNEIALHNMELGKDFVLDPSNAEHIKNSYKLTKNDEQLVVPPRSQALLSTLEYVKMPDNLVGFVELRSTWARHGLLMPPTIIDAGFEGNVTLEIYNTAPYAISLKPGIRFAHIIFATTVNKVKNAYKGTYLRQKGVFLPKTVKLD